MTGTAEPTPEDLRWLTPIALGCLAVAFALAVRSGLPAAFADLRVWQEASADWLAGRSPYTGTYVADLRFNYPPSSLVLLAPLALVPTVAVGTALVAAGMAILGRLCRLALPDLPRPWLLLLVPVLTLSEPALATFSQGQLGYLLLLLMVVAVVPTTGRATGALLGLGTALKVYPAAALVLESRSRAARSTGIAAAVALALTAVAVARVPGLLADWWDQLRAGAVLLRPQDSVRNQSWRGLLEATLGEGPWSRAGWVVAVVLVVALGTVAIRRAGRAGDRLAALSAVCLVVVLAAPVVWTHYWVFLPLLLGTVARGPARGLDRVHRALVVAILALAQLFVVWIPTAADSGSVVASGRWVLTYAYVLVGTAVLATLALRKAPVGRPASAPPGDAA